MRSPFDNIEKQNLIVAINRHKDGGTVFTPPIIEPPDDAEDIITLAPNILDNSDFDFSKDGYNNNPTVGGDTSYEAYNFYRQRFIRVTDLVTTSGSPTVTSASNPFLAAYFGATVNFVILSAGTSNAALSGTLTRVSDGTATLSTNALQTLTDAVMWFGTPLAESSANALKGDAAHSLWAGNEDTNTIIPRWDKTNGWAEIGSDTTDVFDIACPLPLNIVRGGLTFYFKCIVALRSGMTADPVRLYAGVWDATAGQNKWIENTPFDLSASVVGTAGASTYIYKVIAVTDTGMEFESDTVTVNTGNATLSPSNYIRLTWENAPGILDFKIYRDDGTDVKRIFTITNGTNAYNDYGTDEEDVGSLPDAANRRLIMYAESELFTVTSSWASLAITLRVPQGYDTSQTTGKQWLRFGLIGTGDERMVTLDRVLLSTSNGGWQRSARDLNRIANQNPSSLPTSTTQGNTGINCFPLDTPIVTKEGVKLIGDIERGDWVDSGANHFNRVTDVKDAYSKYLIKVVLSNGVWWLSTPSERFITSRADKKGTRIDCLTYGDEILCKINNRVESATIEHLEVIKRREMVRTLSLRGGHTFVAGYVPEGQTGGALCHNRKDQDYNNIEL